MKSKRTIFSPVILFIYIATVLTFAISLIIEYKTSPAKIERRIDELVRATTQNLAVNQADSENFQTALLHSIGPVSDIAGIQLSQGDYLIFSYPRDLADNSPTRSPFVTITERSIYAQNQDTVQMKVASYLIEPSSMYTKGLIAFFVILATTLFCATYLVYLYASGKKNYDTDYHDDSKSDRYSTEKAKPDFLERNHTEEKYDPITETTSTENFDGLDDFDESYDLNESEDINTPDEYEEQNDFDELNDLDEPDKSDDSDQADDLGFQMPQSPSSTITQEEFKALTEDLLDEPFPEDEVQDENIFNEAQSDDNIADDISTDEQELNDRALKNEDLIETMLDEDEEENEYDGSSTDDSKILPEQSSIHTNLDSPVKEEEEKKHLSPFSEKTNVEAKEKSHPAGLFSPRTGFGWEDYMIPRLDSELIRAASGDQDLTVMTIEISKINWESDEAKEICELILDLVKFKDLVFEYGQSGCTAIIQNMGIEEGLKAAEDLHTNIIASLARRKLYYIVSIGLSSRSLRLISGSRIAKESEQALIHAMEDKSNPVVAFKVNPERYRKYIAAESAKLNKKEPQLSVTSS